MQFFVVLMFLLENNKNVDTKLNIGVKNEIK